MSDTPRTDAEAYWLELHEVVQVDFARELERENATLLEAVKNIAMLTANGDAERANWVALGILNDLRAAIDAARKKAQP